jgi:hypothetical protein
VNAKNKKAAEAAFLLNRRTRTRNRKRINLGGRNFLSWFEFAAFFGIPYSSTVDETGRDNWIRTNDPHHVKVVL